MAEAVVNRFYCHNCTSEINPKLPDLICPRCDGEFIEEITELFEDDQQQNQPGRNHIQQTDAAEQFAQLFGQAFLETFRRSAGTEAPTSTTDTTTTSTNNNEPHEMDFSLDDTLSDDEDFSSPYAASPYIVNVARGGAPRGAVRIHHGPIGGPIGGQPSGMMGLEGIIGQILTGLTGGAGGGGTSFRILQPGGHAIPFMFPMHGNPGDYAWNRQELDAVITQLMNQLEGTGPPPADKTQIDSLPTRIITPQDIEKAVQCSVCFDDFALEETVSQLPCFHCYHKDCIVPWLELHGTCPVCRKTLDGHDTSCEGEGLIPEGSVVETADGAQAQTEGASSSSSDLPGTSSTPRDSNPAPPAPPPHRTPNDDLD